MRIERIHVDAFGRLRDFDTGAETLGDLVVVVGPNEAGKSTLFAFLTTALYGFHPASRDRNPHTPWGSDEAAGRVQLKLGSGDCVQVERRLRSSPSGRVVERGEPREIRNQPIPWAEHVPRTVFRQVFAVTLSDLAGIDEETWARIQDRIVGSMGSSDLAPARTVAAELEREASEIWRPNRRGKQRLRDLQETLRVLRRRRVAALERDRQIRLLVEQRENAAVRHRELRAERHEHRARLDGIQTLLPVRRQLARIEVLRGRGGHRDELRDLPADPVGRLEELAGEGARLERRAARLTDELVEPEAVIASLDAEARALLDRADEITDFVAKSVEAAADRRRLRSVREAQAETRHKLVAAAEHFLTGGWSDSLGEAVGSVSVELLRDRVGRLELRRGEPVGQPASGVDLRPGLPLIRVALAASLAAGALLVGWALIGAPTPVLAIGSALLASGGVGLLLQRALRTSHRSDSDAVGQTDVEDLERGIRRMLGDVPVRPEYLSPLSEALITGVARLQELVTEEREHLRAAAALEESVREVDSAGSALARSLGRAGREHADAFGPQLDRQLRAAERAREAAGAAERERRRLLRDIESMDSERASTDDRLRRLEAALAPLGDGDPIRGARSAADRLEAHRRADQLLDELERAHPDLDQMRTQIADLDRSDHDWAVDDREVASLRTRIEELEQLIERCVADAKALERDAAHLSELETVDEVDSEIATLQEAEQQLAHERDRKWVLARLVREADRRFREEHQPDLVRRASEYLAHLTGGRYDRLLVDETDPDGLFRVMGPRLPAPVPLEPPVSTGTLEQAYLSLRFAIVDHLDQGHETLPLFIDEAFVNWDRVRRERGLDLLCELKENRQLFVFTCHPAMAEHLESRGARVVHLARTP